MRKGKPELALFVVPNARDVRDQLLSFDSGQVHLLLDGETLRLAREGQQQRFKRPAETAAKPHVIYDDGIYGSYGI